MKRITFLLSLFVLLSVFTFTSCEEDKYLDWKYINQQWYYQQKQMAENDDEWQITDSGILYKVIYGGIGDNDYKWRPSDKSAVKIAYIGTFFNGEVFDELSVSDSYYYYSLSSYLSGFQETLKMMRQNAIYEVIIPYELGYGEDGSTGIPPYTTLQFQVEMIHFITE